MTSAAETNVHRSPRPGGGAVAVLVAAAALVWLVTNVSPRAWTPPAQTQVALDGRQYRVGAEELEWLKTFSALHFSAGEQEAKALVTVEIDAGLERIFAQARSRLPEFLDWYYSLRGEYSRIAMAALSAVELAEPDYVARQAGSMLLPAEVWTAELERLERDASARLAAHHARLRETWLDEVTRRLAPRRVPTPLQGRSDAANRLALDGLLQEVVAAEREALGRRASLSTIAGAGIGAATPALARAARGARTAAGAAARVATRGASRAGAAAASGAALCAPTGPAAVGCAALGGAAAWIGTDWVLLAADERLHRERLRRELESALDALQEQVAAELEAAYAALVDGHYKAVQGQIRRGFVPARAEGREPGRGASYRLR